MKKHLHIFGLFLLAFIGGYILTPYFQETELQADVNKYDAVKLEDAIIQYHLNVNDIVNDYIDRLINNEEAELGLPPEDGECPPENVSTYCLAMALNDELYLFEQSLLTRQDQFEDAFESETLTLDDAVALHASRVDLINEELASARQAVDLTLAVYNEVQIVYPLHQEFQELILELTKYRDNLAKIRDIVAAFPARFVGATTIYCK